MESEKDCADSSSSSAISQDVSDLGSHPESEESSTRFTDEGSIKKFYGIFDVKIFLLLMCLFSFLQGFALNGINNVNIPMLERRFGLTSTMSGLEASFYDISCACVTLIVGYFIAQYYQPRVFSIAAFTLATGSLVMTLPHFLTGDYQPSLLKNPICEITTNGTESTCESKDNDLSNYLYVFLLGQFLHGLAGTVLYTLVPAYIDGSVSSKFSPQYLGIFYASSALGPALGYLAGGEFLDLYVDIPKPAPSGLTPSSPAWVGAWWIGFLISSASCFLLAFPIFFYPRILPGTVERRKNNVSQAHDHDQQHIASKDGFGKSFRDIPMSLLILAKNPSFVCQSLIGASEGVLVSGLSTFIPKIVANQFNQTAREASQLTGIAAIFGAACGQLLGGILVRRFDWKVKDLIKFNSVCCLFGMAIAGVFWIKCDPGTIAGVTHSYSNSNLRLIDPDLSDACNDGCGCDQSLYKPVCLDGIQYFSGCHAGCSKPIIQGKDVSFTNCTCGANYDSFLRAFNSVNSSLLATQSVNSNIAFAGKCPAKCSTLYVFIPVVFLGILSIFLMSVPGTTVILRSVNYKQRTFAVSIQQLTMRILGTITGPILFGTLMDTACKVWQKDDCGVKGSCWIYDGQLMGQNVFILNLTFKGISLLLNIISYNSYKPPKLANSLSTVDMRNGDIENESTITKM